MVHLYEEFTKYRQIHTDGRKLPDDPNPHVLRLLGRPMGG